MATINETIEIDAPVDAVWAIVRDWGAIHQWVPSLSTVTVQGNERICTATDGMAVRERILDIFEDAHSYIYSIVEAPFPLDDHQSELSVVPSGSGSRVTWRAEFRPTSAEHEAMVVPMLSQSYRDGLESLRSQLEKDPVR